MSNTLLICILCLQVFQILVRIKMPSRAELETKLQTMLDLARQQTTKISSWDVLWDQIRATLADIFAGNNIPQSVIDQVDEAITVMQANSAKIDESLAENVPTQP